MPMLETLDGKPVDVTPVDGDAVNRKFDQAMNDDGPDEQAPPRRQPRAAADPDSPRPRRGRPPKEDRSRTAPKAAVTLDDAQRAEGIKGWAQIGAGLCLMAGKATKNDAFRADAITIASAADDAADACVQIAKTDPGFAAALDRVCAVGPYGALISVMVGVGAQLARNHRPRLVIPGTVDPAELLAEMAKQEAANVPAAA